MAERTSGGGNPPTNPMPPLLSAVREALTESIRVHGVICPVVKDQTGYVLDGTNRIAIAAELGVICPEVVHECDPEQREILKIELNGARRQIGPDEWKPLVDHLRAQVSNTGVRRFSDRVIARAVGIDQSQVSRHKSLMFDATDAAASVASKNLGEDGKVRQTGGEWTAIDRVLHLIRQSKTGLTAVELLGDPVLREFGEGTIRRTPGALRDKGLVEAVGKRDRSTVWAAVPEAVQAESPPPPADPTLVRKARKLYDELSDPKVRDEIRTQLADQKGMRQAEALLRAVEKDQEAARLAEEKRDADEERERLRMIEIARAQADKSVKAWDKLIAELHAAWTLIAAYSQVFEDLPAIHPSFCRMLDREIVELRRQLDWFDKQLHPDPDRLHADTDSLRKGTVIDI